MAAQSLDSFAAELLGLAATAAVKASPVVKKVAQTVKDEAQENVHRSAPTHNAGADRAINYDEPVLAGTQVRTEVGYDRDKPGGALGNLLEYGGGGDRSPAHRDIGRAADSAEEHFADAVKKLADHLL